MISVTAALFNRRYGKQKELGRVNGQIIALTFHPLHRCGVARILTLSNLLRTIMQSFRNCSTLLNYARAREYNGTCQGAPAEEEREPYASR